MKKGTVSDRLILKNRAVDLFSNVPRVFAVFVDPRGIPANRCHPKCAFRLDKIAVFVDPCHTLGRVLWVPSRPWEGDKGGGKPPPGKGEERCN